MEGVKFTNRESGMCKSPGVRVWRVGNQSGTLWLKDQVLEVELWRWMAMSTPRSVLNALGFILREWWNMERF